MGADFQQLLLLLHWGFRWLSQGKVLTLLCDLHEDEEDFLSSPLVKHKEDRVPFDYHLKTAFVFNWVICLILTFFWWPEIFQCKKYTQIEEIRMKANTFSQHCKCSLLSFIIWPQLKCPHQAISVIMNKLAGPSQWCTSNTMDINIPTKSATPFKHVQLVTKPLACGEKQLHIG